MSDQDWFQELIRIMPPPSRPRHSIGDWAPIEAELGTRLPNNYKQFISTYGMGKICKSFWINSYFDLAPNESVLGIVSTYLNTYREVQAIGVEIPYPLFPAKNGLLPFGGGENGDSLNWLTTSSPEKWDVVYYGNSIDAFYTVKDQSLFQFLVEVLTQRWTYFSDAFDSEAFEEIVFEPRD